MVFCGLENNKKLSNPADCEVTLRRCEKILNHNLKRPESKIKFDDLIDGLKHIKLEDSDFAIQNRIQ